jgi:hypothetical protein
MSSKLIEVLLNSSKNPILMEANKVGVPVAAQI